MSRMLRFGRLLPALLAAGVRREWPLAVLALLCLAPSVAALVAWLQLAWRVAQTPPHSAQFGWLLPPSLMATITPAGVLVGCGLVTLLVGCLGLSNAYLTSVERRLGDLSLLLNLGLSRLELMGLLLIEALGLGALGAGAGLVLGIALSVLSWLPARDYLGLAPGFALEAAPLWIATLAAILAALLFVGVTGVVTGLHSPRVGASDLRPRHWMRDWGHWRFSTMGTLFTALLTCAVGLPILGWQTTAVLTLLALGLALLLNTGSWLLTRFYWRLPTPESRPLWALAVQGLARHRRQTAGMTLAMTAGALGVGLAALGSVGQAPRSQVIFPVWVAAVLLATCASLVMTTAALAALERRPELGLLAALGARPGRVRRLILLEYGIVAVGGGSLGALLALWAWWLSGLGNRWLLALAVAAVDVVAAVLTAWLGAIPVLWLIARQPPGESLHDRPWLKF